VTKENERTAEKVKKTENMTLKYALLKYTFGRKRSRA
jgi:hypothetical protein